jgi:mRNA interferase MazF
MMEDCHQRIRFFLKTDEINRYLQTVIVAPLTTVGRPYPTRVGCVFQEKKGQVVLDQVRTVDRVRLAKRLGKLSPSASSTLLAVLAEMFAE